MIDDNQTSEPQSDTTETEDFATFEQRVAAKEPDEGTKADDEPEKLGEETDEGETGENGTGEPEGGEDDEPQPKKGKSVQERFDEITAARREAERDAEFWRAKALEKEAPQSDATNEPDATAAPDPAGFDYGEADPQYIRALARYEARQEFAAQAEQARVASQIHQIEAQYGERLTKAKEKLPDFDEKVTASADRGEWPCPPLVAIGIKSSEVGPEVAYHLANNREEAVAISHMSPIEQARAFGRLEARFMHQPEAKPAKVATDAPEPAPARSRGAGGRFSADDDTDNFADFEAKYSRDKRRA